MGKNKVAVVVPTLGTRADYLKLCIESIRKSESAHIILVKPRDVQIDSALGEYIDSEIDDPGGGAASAIAEGFKHVPEGIEYLTWLGDDDTLEPGSLDRVVYALGHDPSAVAVFGACNYVDPEGRSIWLNRPKQTSKRKLIWAPNRLPQPGSLFRASAYAQVGGLDVGWKYAFDQDLFTRLAAVGDLKILDEVVANFRWHAGSLSAGQKSSAMREALKVRLEHASQRLGWMMLLWEVPRIGIAILLGASLDRAARRVTKS
jgi:glycosyltransferase involved in cell wall biosynthesis